ncbi:MAG TPA: Tat pathway signal protein [Caulobacteraceae bacterium]|nr:Tat pathway signal protein [Caulobacteraceae bacterium]
MDRRHLLAAALFVPAVATAGSADAASSGPKERKKGGGPNFLQLPTLTASVVRLDGRRGVLTVEAGVDAPDAAGFERAEALRPRLRDAYNAALFRFAAALRPGFAPDADQLARDLQTATDRVYGKRGLKLLLGSIVVN